MTDSDLAKLNKYMGGTGDAEEFITPIDGSEHPSVEAHQSNTFIRADKLMSEINLIRKLHGLSFDQALQVWIAANIGDPHAYPPITERKG